MREAAYVIQIQRVGGTGVVDSRDVVVGERRRLRQIIHRIRVRQSGRKILRSARRLQRKIQLGRAEFHIVVPDVLGIAVKWRNGEQAGVASAGTGVWSGVWIGSVGKRKNVFGIEQAL